MAIINRYVDPDATGGGTGVDWTNAYTSLSAWNVAEANNLVTNGNSHVVHCRSSAGTADTTSVSLGSGWVMGASNTLTIQVDQADRHNGTWQTSKYRLAPTGTNVNGITLGARQYITIDGLQFSLASSSTGYQCVNMTAANPQVTIRNCIFKDAQRGVAHAAINALTTTDSIKIYNCIFYNCGATSDGAIVNLATSSNTAPFSVYNCTVVDCYLAVDCQSVTNNIFLVKNTIFAACSQATVTTDLHANSDYIASTGTDTVGTNSRQSQSFTFVNYSGDNFHLGATDTGAKNFGVDLSSIFTTDIDGATRSGTWDIGADEITANEYSINAATTLALTPGATTSKHEGYNCSGSTQLDFTVAASSLVKKEGYILNGSTVLDITIAATTAVGYNSSGDNTIYFVPQASMEFWNAGAFSINGSITTTFQVAASALDFADAKLIYGSNTTTLTPTATTAVGREITGSISSSLVPQATFDFREVYTLNGHVSLDLTPTATLMQFAEGYRTDGSITTSFTTSASTQYSGVQSIVRYVDPSATGTINGLTWETAYRSLAAWHAAQTNKNLVTLQSKHVVYCRSNSGVADTAAVSVSGWTTSSVYNLEIHSINNHYGIWNTTNAYNLVNTGTNTVPLEILVPYTKIIGLQIMYNGTWNTPTVSLNAASCKFQNCIIRTGSSPGTTAYPILLNNDTGIFNTFFINCLIYGGKTYNHYSTTQAGQIAPWATYYNCTFGTCGSAAIFANAGTIRCKNCLFTNTGAAMSTGLFHSTSDYNASTRNDVIGLHSRVNQTFSLINAAAGDYHLSGVDTGAKDFGVDLSNDSLYPFSNDIDDTDRVVGGTTWDIGADEFDIPNESYGIYGSAAIAFEVGASLVYTDYVENPNYYYVLDTNISTFVRPVASSLVYVKYNALPGEEDANSVTISPDPQKAGNPGGWSGAGFEPNNNWAWCPVCGMNYRAKEFRKTWDNRMVCKECWEPRHEQDFLKITPDKLQPDLMQLEPENEVTTLDDVPNSSFLPKGTFDNDI